MSVVHTLPNLAQATRPAANKSSSGRDRSDRKGACRRTTFQRWLAESQSQEVALDQRLLDLCG